jgi:hypothetical protein
MKDLPGFNVEFHVLLLLLLAPALALPQLTHVLRQSLVTEWLVITDHHSFLEDAVGLGDARLASVNLLPQKPPFLLATVVVHWLPLLLEVQ